MIVALAVPAGAVAFVMMILTQQAGFGNTEAQTQPLEFLLRELTPPGALTVVLMIMATSLVSFLLGAYVFWGGAFVSLDRLHGEVVTWRRYFFRFRRQRYPLRLFKHVTIDRVVSVWSSVILVGVDEYVVRLEGPTFRVQVARLGQRRYLKAKRRAEEVADYLGMKIVDRAGDVLKYGPY